MPQPSWIRFVAAAITARTAVDDRASNPCLRHQGYASAIQKASKPACSQAVAMATVSRTGSILSCRTPILNGMRIVVRLTPLSIAKMGRSVGVGPGVLEPFDEFPQCAIERRGHTGLFAPLHNCTVHEINFGLTFCKNILQHAGTVLSGRVRALLNQLASISMQLNPEGAGDRLPFPDEILEEASGRLEPGSGTVMEQRQRTHGIGRRIKDQLCPLRPTGILQRNRIHTRARHQTRQFLHPIHGSLGWLERPYPRSEEH